MTAIRVRLLETIRDMMSNYLLDDCPDDQNWEDSDPEIDGLRGEVTDLMEAMAND
jgi:hypothetical protein